MDPRISLLVLVATLALAVAGFTIWARGYREQAELARAESLGVRGDLRMTLLGPLERRVLATGRGRRLQLALASGALDRVLVVEAMAVVGAAVLLVIWLSSLLVAPPWALLCGVFTLWALRAWLRGRQHKQLLAFLAQMPELARVLSNATSAGLSIRTALELAAEEVAPPARQEIERVVRSLQVGTPLEEALQDLEDRLPGRELRVLVGTLVISHRAGGSLITALRTISDTLEDRKELNREVRTVLTQATYTGYLVVAMGIGLLLMLNTVSPGLLRQMTSQLLGQVALSVALGLFGLGLVIIRRMTRIDL